MGTDGTELGTKRVKDIRPGIASSSPSFLTAWKGLLYFQADNGSGRRLWVSDGSRNGTRRLSAVPFAPSALKGIGSRRLYMSGHSATTGYEVFVSDGTAAPGQLRVDVQVGAASSNPASFTALNGKVLFVADGGVKGRELWCIDNGATATQIGDVVGAAATVDATDPVLGQTSIVRGHNTLTGAPVNFHALGMRIPERSTFAGSISYLDLAKPLFLLPTTTGRNYSFGIPIPQIPSLTGVTAVLQTWSFETVGELRGIQLSNGVTLTVGK